MKALYENLTATIMTCVNSTNTTEEYNLVKLNTSLNDLERAPGVKNMLILKKCCDRLIKQKLLFGIELTSAS